MQTEAAYLCESCGEQIVIPVDLSAGAAQTYVEDCPVCCRPHVLRVQISPTGEIEVQAEAE